ncbi:MAG TPA: formyltransferase family protein [Gemmatimonadales bacterium]|nr:formyltransferase family protein [Gemmatimonadales bacterium]
MVTTSSSPEFLRPGPRRPHRIVALCSDGALERHTCATLVGAGVDLVGIVLCARRGIRARATFLARWARRHGLLHTTGQVLGRFYDRARNGRADARELGKLIHEAEDRAVLRQAAIPVVETDSYSRADTREAIRRLGPDIFVVHTKYIVGPSVRALAPVATIGGHPGITPFYRGQYPTFWALSRGETHMVGWSVFLLDDGIDTGPILSQERVPIDSRTDSHLTIAWKGMIRIAERQAQAIRRLDAGDCLPLRPVREIPPGSYFGPPTLLEFLRYHRRYHRRQGIR